MLMFDKQTNRHRGKSLDSFTLENLNKSRVEVKSKSLDSYLLVFEIW